MAGGVPCEGDRPSAPSPSPLCGARVACLCPPPLPAHIACVYVAIDAIPFADPRPGSRIHLQLAQWRRSGRTHCGVGEWRPPPLTQRSLPHRGWGWRCTHFVDLSHRTHSYRYRVQRSLKQRIVVVRSPPTGAPPPMLLTVVRCRLPVQAVALERRALCLRRRKGRKSYCSLAPQTSALLCGAQVRACVARVADDGLFPLRRAVCVRFVQAS